MREIGAQKQSKRLTEKTENFISRADTKKLGIGKGASAHEKQEQTKESGKEKRSSRRRG